RLSTLDRRRIGGRPIAAFPWRWNLQRFRPRDVRKPCRTYPRRLAAGLSRQRFHNFLWCDWHFVDAHADPVGHRVRAGRHHRQQRSLADFLGAERSLRIGMLDELGEYFGHVEGRRTLVLEHRRKLVDEGVREPRREPAEFLLFHQRLAERHIDTSLDLPPN